MTTRRCHAGLDPVSKSVGEAIANELSLDDPSDPSDRSDSSIELCVRSLAMKTIQPGDAEPSGQAGSRSTG
jgi:hypothetical protein